MALMNIFEHGAEKKQVDPADDKDQFVVGKTGPAEIEHIPIVSGVSFGEYCATPDGDGVVKYHVDQGYYPGQVKIREVAALMALKNSVSPTWAEFGVELGRSAYFLSMYLPKDGQFFLFDSFEGLPEDWALSYKDIRPGGTWACDPPQFEDSRLIVVPGWFDDVLPHADMQGPLGLVHIDSDLYSSAKTVLERLNDQIVPGTIILFDELWGYPNWADGEYKALMEWGREFTYIARDTKFRAVIEVQ